MLKNLLLYRFVLFNAGLSALFAYFVSKGYVAAALVADPTGLTLLIGIIFLLLLGSTSRRVWKIAKGLNRLKAGDHPDASTWTKREVKNQHIHDGASWLAYLGLIGTVIGFIMALGGLDVGTLATVAGVKTMIPSLMGGMKVALYTTLSGAFFGIWTEVNYRMLDTATKCLIEDEKASLGHE